MDNLSGFITDSRIKGMSDDAIRTALLNMGNNPAKITSAFESLGANRTRQDIDEYAVETSLIAAREQATIKPTQANPPEEKFSPPVSPATPAINQPLSKPTDKMPNLPTMPAKPADIAPVQPISKPSIKLPSPQAISRQIAEPIDIPAGQPVAPSAPKHLTPEEFMAKYGVQTPAQPSGLQKEAEPPKEPAISISPMAVINPANTPVNPPVQPTAPVEISSNNGKKIALIILGALLALALGAGTFFLLGKTPSESPQINATSTTEGGGP